MSIANLEREADRKKYVMNPGWEVRKASQGTKSLCQSQELKVIKVFQGANVDDDAGLGVRRPHGPKDSPAQSPWGLCLSVKRLEEEEEGNSGQEEEEVEKEEEEVEGEEGEKEMEGEEEEVEREEEEEKEKGSKWPGKSTVTTNGIIAMSEPPAKESHPGLFPPTFGAVAPFLADLDTTDGLGKVYYREDFSPSITQRAAECVQRGFPEISFQPSTVVVVTWESVAPYQGPSRDPDQEGKRNTFQAVLASSDSSSYAIFLYPEDGLQFHTTFSKKENNQVPAVVAFSQGSVGYLWKSNGAYNIFANDRESIENLAKSSNSGQQGVWVFEIGSPATTSGVVPADVILGTEDGAEYDDEDEDYVLVTTRLGLEDVGTTPFPYKALRRGGADTYSVPSVLSPRRSATEKPLGPPTERTRSFQLAVETFHQQHPQVLDVDEVEETGVVFSYNTDSRQTCASNRHQCSVHAECRDYATGFCCSCVAGYMGNGRQCVAEGSPQRVNGKVKGRIFVGNSQVPIVFENTDLHSYVVMNHGRSYTAISTIPETLGYSLLPLAPVGGIIGWMFAVEQDGFKNGFSITGGEFTRQAEVTFVEHPGKLVIKQRFSGIDEHGHLTIDTELEGRVPQIPFGSSVHIEPYTELYHYSSSVITSSSTREYMVTEPERDGAAPSRIYTYQWRQTITFQECVHDASRRALPGTQQLSVDSVFVLYNQEERILRYALSNSIGPVREGSPDALQNPCYIGTHGCDTNAACRPGSRTQFTCECSIGFRGDGRTCYGTVFDSDLLGLGSQVKEIQKFNFNGHTVYITLQLKLGAPSTTVQLAYMTATYPSGPGVSTQEAPPTPVPVCQAFLGMAEPAKMWMNASQADVTRMPSATTPQAPSHASANRVIREMASVACLEDRDQTAVIWYLLYTEGASFQKKTKLALKHSASGSGTTHLRQEENESSGSTAARKDENMWDDTAQRTDSRGTTLRCCLECFLPQQFELDE
ncbi:Nidogen-1 [Saguinus oedipus]|uniref:Nidogen-1 n=1 Tax=Saguinus oedipus TaxID=9490 RepID=A0ABQ9TML6_SAGOE|nr:Nidogen-1 [Saguinus oedipus]